MRQGAKWAVLAIACAVSILLAIGIGSVSIDVRQILSVFGQKAFGMPPDPAISDATVAILWTIRLPRVLLAFLVGALLSVSGAVMQSVLRNPLASSYTLGVSSGASLGAALIILTGYRLPLVGAFTLPFMGLLCGLLTVFFAVTFVSRVDHRMQSNTIILAGMVFSLFINAVLTMVYSFAKEKTEQLVRWQMGSFALKGWTEVGLLLPLGVIGLLALFRYAPELDMLTFGEEDAGAMGVDTRRMKWLLLGLAAALTGSAVAFAGVIGFVDLIVPHLVRRLYGARHRAVLPASALLGGAFMVLCDLAARALMAPTELPVGAVTAILGAPFFGYVYFHRGRRAEG